MGLILVVGFVAALWWSVSYQRRALTIVRGHRDTLSTPAAVPAVAAPAVAAVAVAGPTPTMPTTPPPAPKPPTDMTSSRRSGPMTVAPSSVLGWESFALISILVLDGAVLLGCRRGPVRSDGPGVAAMFGEEDQTMVLLLGTDDRADAAVALLERWRARGTELRLRPTRVAGAIEVLDERSNAVRAALLAS